MTRRPGRGGDRESLIFRLVPGTPVFHRGTNYRPPLDRKRLPGYIS